MERKVSEFISQQIQDPIVQRQICEQCTAEFPIFQRDKELLEKLAPTVGNQKQYFSLPQFCPECRARQRLVRRNEWNFYSRTSTLSGKKIFSLYSPEAEVKVYDYDERYSDKRNASDFAQDIDFDGSIQKQLTLLRKQIPTLSVVTIDNQNCAYTTGTGYCKNCYLINSSENCEDCMYGKLFQTCKDCIDCSYVYDSEKLYECINVKKGYTCAWVQNTQESSFCYFSDDLIGCQNCMFCSGLRNAQYYFENKQCSKEEREEKSKDFLGNRENISRGLQKFEDVIKNKIAKYANVVNSEASFGDFQTDNKNCVSCYDVNGSHDCRYVTVGVEIKDVVDANNVYLGPEKCYDCVGIMHVQDVHFCVYVFDSHSLILCQECYDSNHLFGCIGLRNKSYCIFNKQYTQEEYEKIVPQLIEKMKKDGEWRMFNPSFAAYPYNDSLAMEYYPIQKIIFANGEEKILDAEGKGVVKILEEGKAIVKAELNLGGSYIMPIKWRIKETEINVPETLQKIEARQLPGDIDNVDDTILEKAVICAESGRPFRILKQELEFYRRNHLPVPDKHPSVRYQGRLKKKAKRDLHVRTCDNCNVEIVSVYPQENQCKVYCEACYNKEIY